MMQDKKPVYTWLDEPAGPKLPEGINRKRLHQVVRTSGLIIKDYDGFLPKELYNSEMVVFEDT